MVTQCRCRYCGQESPLPLYFSLTVQRVVNFIIDNPWCSARDIELGVYGRTTGTNVISTRLCQIRKQLKGTPWRLVGRQHPSNHHQRQYQIRKVKATSPKAIANAPTDSINSLSR